MKQRGITAAAILAMLVPVFAAAAKWIEADTERKRAETAQAESYRAWDGYGEFITEQLRRDEALIRAIRSLQARLETAREDCGPHMDFRDTPRAARHQAAEWPHVDLDEVARQHGYEAR